MERLGRSASPGRRPPQRRALQLQGAPLGRRAQLQQTRLRSQQQQQLLLLQLLSLLHPPSATSVTLQLTHNLTNNHERSLQQLPLRSWRYRLVTNGLLSTKT